MPITHIVGCRLILPGEKLKERFNNGLVLDAIHRQAELEEMSSEQHTDAVYAWHKQRLQRRGCARQQHPDATSTCSPPSAYLSSWQHHRIRVDWRGRLSLVGCLQLAAPYKLAEQVKRRAAGRQRRGEKAL